MNALLRSVDIDTLDEYLGDHLNEDQNKVNDENEQLHHHVDTNNQQQIFEHKDDIGRENEPNDDNNFDNMNLLMTMKIIMMSIII